MYSILNVCPETNKYQSRGLSWSLVYSCLQASLKQWLGFDHHTRSFRQFTFGFEGILKEFLTTESSAGAVPGVKVSDISFAGIPVRVYEPPAGGEGHLRRGLMYFHGGGWAVGTTSESLTAFSS